MGYSYGCCLVSRNDNYGGNLKERATYALNSCIETYDEVIYFDWNSKGKTLIDEIESDLIHSGKLRYIRIPPELHMFLTADFVGAQPCCEVLGRNAGLRRLNTDFLISTNIDDIAPERGYLENFKYEHLMGVVARHMVSLETVQGIGDYKDITKIRNALKDMDLKQAWPVTRDPYSLVEWCGDLQIAHRSVWYAVKGFEESQLGRNVADSFLQRKVFEMAYGIHPFYDIPFWHIDHNNSSDYNDGDGVVYNSSDCLSGDFTGTTNSDTWGLLKYNFGEKVI